MVHTHTYLYVSVNNMVQILKIKGLNDWQSAAVLIEDLLMKTCYALMVLFYFYLTTPSLTFSSKNTMPWSHSKLYD